MDIPQWVWNEPQLLECPDDWRITSQAAQGVPYHRDGRHMQTLILGREEHFQQRERVREVLRTVQERLGLDGDSWQWQSPFYEQFIRSFFRGTASPGWIKISNSRLSFRNRIDGTRGHSVHRGGSSRRLFRAKYLGAETLPLGDLVLPTSRLRMKLRPGIASDEQSVYEVKIFRTLTDDGLGGPLNCQENWLLLGSRDPSEHRARRRGVNMAVQEYPAADPDGRMCPLISCCRLTADRRWVVSRCFSLSPASAECVDFRSVLHRTAFYCRSDLSNAVLLSRAVTPGQFERFVNG